jgi:transketolase
LCVVVDDIQELEQIAKDLRCQTVRMIQRAGSGHPGGALSAADIVSVLYFKVLRVNPDRPDWPDRDRFVLSKGHACPVVYAALARRGFFPEEDLWTLRQIGSHLQGHPDMRKTSGIDATTGSLGQGFSVAAGLALAAKINRQAYRVYVLLGCGEQQEGQVWEAAMAAAHFKMDNLTAFVDYNCLQLDGTNAQIMEIAPLDAKWQAFGWHVLKIDGHNVRAILDAIAEAQQTRGRPTVIIARTTKGKGVSFMEDEVGWHAGALTQAQLDQALVDLCQV